jgi:hypothetical protein
MFGERIGTKGKDYLLIFLELDPEAQALLQVQNQAEAQVSVIFTKGEF